VILDTLPLPEPFQDNRESEEAVMTIKKLSDPSTKQETASNLYSELYNIWFSKQSPLIQSQILMIMNEKNKEQAAASQVSMAQSAISQAASCAARPQDIPEIDLDYEKIVSIIFNAGKDMERRRKTYAARKEEELRDHLLTALNGQYRGKATAETFSSDGKTDIFLPLDGEKAFIAECKIWRGENKFSKAINQLLGQPIRSDTKTALIVFNHNKNTSEVMAKIKEVVKGHPNYKRFDENTESETKLCYTLHHPKDQALELTLTVLVFDLPD